MCVPLRIACQHSRVVPAGTYPRFRPALLRRNAAAVIVMPRRSPQACQAPKNVWAMAVMTSVQLHYLRIGHLRVRLGTLSRRNHRGPGAAAVRRRIRNPLGANVINDECAGLSRGRPRGGAFAITQTPPCSTTATSTNHDGGLSGRVRIVSQPSVRRITACHNRRRPRLSRP
jgi:hypothetical protein